MFSGGGGGGGGGTDGGLIMDELDAFSGSVYARNCQGQSVSACTLFRLYIYVLTRWKKGREDEREKTAPKMRGEQAASGKQVW